MGVNIHFTGAPERDLDMIRAAGFGWVRMDFVWEEVEREKGVYRFEEYDALLAGLEARGMKALFILDYSNKLHEEAQSVRTQAGREAFARFAGAAAGRYRGRGVWWEVWNEPNLAQFWKPEPNVEDYALLFEAAAKAIRDAEASAKVLGPASSGLPWPFLEALLRRGSAGSHLSIHPYRSTRPETVVDDYVRLEELMKAHNFTSKTPAHGRRALPVVSGEWGYSTVHHGGLRISEEQQAAYFARMMLTNLSQGVALSIWYDWANDGPSPEETEHNFGLVTQDRKPKPAYLAAGTLARFLDGKGVKAVRSVLEGGHAADLEGGTAVWVEGEPRTIGFRLARRRCRVRVTSLAGVPSEVAVKDGVLAVPASGSPQYFKVLEAEGEAQPEAVYDLGVEAHSDRVVVQALLQGHREPGSLTVEIGTGEARTKVGQRVELESGRAERLEIPVTWLTDRPTRVEAALHDEAGKALHARVQPFACAAVTAFVSDWPRQDAEPTHLTASLDGDGNVAGDALLVAARTRELTPRGENALRCEYRFGKGHKFATVKPGKGLDGIPGQPRSLSLWVKGDGNGNILRVRFRDASGETFQPTAGAVGWTGWRRVTIPLDGSSASSWGSGKDGKVDYPIVWESLLVLDSNRDGSAGAIEVASPILLYAVE